jgi:hypothetical protein
MKMNNTTLLALIILSVLSASAQKRTSPDCSAKTDTAIVLAQDYAARVDGLLRDTHASLRSISERVEAESMPPERAEQLKLAVTRDMISRLDTLSAVYDVRPNDVHLNDVRLKKNAPVGKYVDKDKDNAAQAPAGSGCATDKVRPTNNGNATVSVKELQSESASRFEAARPRQSSGASNGSY